MDGPSNERVQALLGGLRMVSRIEFVPTISSTNEALLHADTEPGQVLVADIQTLGRGRRGRLWHAPGGTSLMFSIALRPRLSPGVWPLLTLLAGTAVAEACQHLTGLGDRVRLKWPNDLLVDDAKCAGILVESTGSVVVIGIGVNTDWRDVERPEGIVATSLSEMAAAPIDRWDLFEEVLGTLDTALVDAERDPAGVVQRYVPHCATLGRTVVAHAQPSISGKAIGLTMDGHLRIRTPEGRTIAVAAGEVEHLR